MSRAAPPSPAPAPNPPAAEAMTGTDDLHALAAFEGPDSRRHARVPVRALRRRARLHRLLHPAALRRVRVFAQFAGYPRSGHSLVGAMLDAHPEARLAHELDAMGLFAKGMLQSDILPLCHDMSLRFAADGRWWNGLRYEIADAPAPRAPRVIGDKKGDWAVRWCLREPGLLRRFEGHLRPEPRWIVVTRHPLDVVATMSLRVGRDYDRIRIAHRDDPARAAAAIRDAQARGDIATAARDDMVADFLDLTDGVLGMMRAGTRSRWHVLPYETLVARPKQALADLADFLDLDPDPAWIAACARLVRPAPPRRDRHPGDRVEWRPDQRAALARACDASDMLETYRGTF